MSLRKRPRVEQTRESDGEKKQLFRAFEALTSLNPLAALMPDYFYYTVYTVSA